MVLSQSQQHVLLVYLLILAHSSSLSRGEAEDKQRQRHYEVAEEEVIVVEHPNCRLYLAESTIPGAGLGIYSGVELKVGDAVADPDIVVPLSDQSWHTSDKLDFNILWDDYAWDVSTVDRMDTDMFDGSALVLGKGSMANYHFAGINVHEEEYPSKVKYDHTGLDRSVDPGSFGFTGWYNQRMVVEHPIKIGDEIFVDYGDEWFTSRTESRKKNVWQGDVPLSSSFGDAVELLEKLKYISDKYENNKNKYKQSNSPSSSFTDDLWNIVKSISKEYNSRYYSALLHFQEMVESRGKKETTLSRSLSWLKENGRCMDNIKPGVASTIDQAGRGAFATRFIPKGGLVAPGPLLPIQDYRALNVYEGNPENENNKKGELIGRQLIMNYCFGHSQSTLLLCPYATPSAYINHNNDDEKVNVKIEWASDDTPGHNSSWLNEDINFLKERNRVGLSINFIATRDIVPDEEIFLDYGNEWYDAWTEYVKQFREKATTPQEKYINAFDIEKDYTIPLRTITEQMKDPYPNNIVFYCHYNYTSDSSSEGPLIFNDDWYWLKTILPCRIISREEEKNKWYSNNDFDDLPPHDDDDDDENNNKYSYQVLIMDESEVQQLLKNVSIVYRNPDNVIIPKEAEKRTVVRMPRKAIKVKDRPYTKNEFLWKKSFRHPMMFPDEIFPKSWRNIKEGYHTYSHFSSYL